MKKVLITGADGFIGSHLTEALLEEGYSVTALCLYNSFNDWGWLENISNPNLNIISGDVRDPHFCKHITQQHRHYFSSCRTYSYSLFLCSPR